MEYNSGIENNKVHIYVLSLNYFIIKERQGNKGKKDGMKERRKLLAKPPPIGTVKYESL